MLPGRLGDAAVDVFGHDRFDFVADPQFDHARSGAGIGRARLRFCLPGRNSEQQQNQCQSANRVVPRSRARRARGEAKISAEHRVLHPPHDRERKLQIRGSG